MNVFKTIRNYLCYCGIEKDEYNALKKDAYISNFRVWRVLHFLMAAVFGTLFAGSLFSHLMKTNQVFYLGGLIYSVAAVFLFFRLREDSLAAQFLIYLSISVLFLFACSITQNKPDTPSTTFFVFLLITSMFMIDKPYFMAIELIAASAVFLVWMRSVKTYEIWRYDLINVIVYTVIGIFLNVIANSIRIKEFVLTRRINIQKDTDELTGLKNKGALTREINLFLTEGSSEQGTMLLLDIDHFKSINDTYGHDVGDQVISRMGHFLADYFSGDEIVGRFGGDEFIVFIRNMADPDAVCRIANGLIRDASEKIVLPEEERGISVSVGAALYHGQENNYSDIFKKADTALYRAKADRNTRYCVFE